VTGFREAERFDAAVRWILRRLRLWLDAADERVHSWEIVTRKESVPAASTAPGKVGQAIRCVGILGESCDRNMKAPGAELSRPRSGVGNPARHGPKRIRRKVSARDFDERSAARLHDLAADFESAWSAK
jgi:hypothetical protein